MKKQLIAEEKALFFLTRIPGLGKIKIERLFNYFGSYSDCFNAPSTEIAKILDTTIASYWQDKYFEKLEMEWDFLENHSIEVLPHFSKNYPSSLLTLTDFPTLLYRKSTQAPNLEKKCIAIIGTRNATFYGLEMAKKFAFELARQGYTIVSGLARGIDTAAHEGALEAQGKTMAVIGSGFGNIYPKENIALTHKIVESEGSLISEYFWNIPPDKRHFPQRNRIVSGLSLAVLLIEAPIKSGAMLTANLALQAKKRVFCIPGRIDQENYQGNHQLLKQNKAILVENSEDILLAFDDLFPKVYSNNLTECDIISLDEDEIKLLEVFPNQEVSIEELARLYPTSPGKLNYLLMSLQIKKIIKEFPGKLFKKQARLKGAAEWLKH